MMRKTRHGYVQYAIRKTTDITGKNINHVIPTHGENKQNIPIMIGKGKLVGKEDCIISKMAHDYGRLMK